MADEENYQDTEQEAPEKVKKPEPPVTFLVHSMVRRTQTRTKRASSPQRHRFKQYLFNDPSRRLMRSRPVRITEKELEENLDDLKARQAAGLLRITAPDGRHLDMGTMTLGDHRIPAPVYHRRLDSVEHDKPAGIAMQRFVNGAPQGDPAAQRAAERLSKEKAEVAEAAGNPPGDEEPAASVDEPQEAINTEPAELAAIEETELQTEPKAETETVKMEPEAPAVPVEEEAPEPTPEPEKKSGRKSKKSKK